MAASQIKQVYWAGIATSIDAIDSNYNSVFSLLFWPRSSI